MVHIAHDPETKIYFERRIKAGKTKPEVIRILKRYVAREVYRYLPRRINPRLRVWLSLVLSALGSDFPAIRRPAVRAS
jgi:hypothetical protein